MQAINVYDGKTVALMRDNVDTDQIMPKAFLKRVEKKGFGQFVFFDWRYSSPEVPNPDFPLNDPDRQEATILITGENFGCGSSREHAAWGIADYGIRVIIAGGYSDIFYMNCTKNGLLPIVLTEDQRDQLAGLGPDEEITIDLPNQVVKSKFGDFPFEIDATWKRKFINGIDDIDETLQYQDQIAAYEAKVDHLYD